MRRPRNRSRGTLAALAAAAVATPLLLTAPAGAQPAAPATEAVKGERLADKLVRRTDAWHGMLHLQVFQAIADFNDDNRGAGTRGYDQSAWYAGTLLKIAGYDVTYQDFEFRYRETVHERLRQLTPDARDIEMRLMSHTANSPDGGTESGLAAVPVDEDGTTGCEPEDFAGGDYTGAVALIKRGGCTFALKQANAADAGAIGAVIYNNQPDGVVNGTLGEPGAGVIPTGGISLADGEALAAALADGDDVTVDLEINEFSEMRTTRNVIAETPGGDPDNVVMAGAHLDSVAEGPGINDNGSGSAGVLETALQFARAAKIDHPNPKHENKVRFALWGAEELGLLGSEHYVEELTQDEADAIALYLNFDMIASPNYGLFVYDGDGSEGISAPGPDGSAQIEHAINSFFTEQGHAPRATAFSGRSDYGPFIAVGIPAGGTFTGAEGIKTEAQVELWGGEAGTAFDPCYHDACDDIDNIDMTAFDANMKVIAHLIGVYSWSTDGLTEPVPPAAPADPDTTDAGGLHDHGHEAAHR